MRKTDSYRHFFWFANAANFFYLLCRLLPLVALSGAIMKFYHNLVHCVAIKNLEQRKLSTCIFLDRSRGSESHQWTRGKFFGGPPTFCRLMHKDNILRLVCFYKVIARKSNPFTQISDVRELVGCLFIPFIAKKRLR